MYNIIFDRKALEFLNKHDKKLKKRIFKKIISTKEDPFRFFRKLSYRQEYKLRVGSYRIIADIDKKSKKIKIRLIMHRRRYMNDIK